MQFYEFYSDFRSEKSYKGVYVHGLILGNVASTLQDCLQPPRHLLHKGLQEEVFLGVIFDPREGALRDALTVPESISQTNSPLSSQ